MEPGENALERNLRCYKEAKEKIEEWKLIKSKTLERIEEARKTEPFYSLQYRLISDPGAPSYQVGIFTTIEKAKQYEQSLNKDLETFEYEIVEYPLHCTLGDSTMSFINKTPQ